MHTDEAIEVLQHYQLGTLTELHKGHQGFANINYRLTTTSGVYLYRINLEQSLETIAYEHRLLNYLDTQGLPIAPPIPRSDGEMITATPSGPVVIYTFVDGGIPESNVETVKAIAHASARLNSLPVPDDLLRSNPLSVDQADIWLQKPLPADEALRKCIADELNHLRQFLQEPLPHCLVHGDLFADNTLYKDNQLMAMIDFEEACTDTRLFEIGVTINGFCAPDNQPDARLISVFLERYEAQSPLSDQEHRLLPAYIHWGALTMACWHLKNPTPEKLDRVRLHMERLSKLQVMYPLNDI
jgi:homoserine kinase type II